MMAQSNRSVILVHNCTSSMWSIFGFQISIVILDTI
jgi:hypothetical protein